MNYDVRFVIFIRLLSGNIREVAGYLSLELREEI